MLTQRTMDEHLLGYLLNALEPEELRQVEIWLKAHPEGQARVERLRQALAPLAAERDTPIEPPPGLAVRTLARVAEHICRDLPHAPKTAVVRSLGPARPSWRRVDVLIAACLLITLLGLLSLWLLRTREQAGLVDCRDSLREVYVGLKSYSERHQNRFPCVSEVAEPPRDVAGLIIPMLIAHGYLSGNLRIGCPAKTDKPTPIPLKEALKMEQAQFEQQAGHFTPCYAYSLGYRNEQGLVLPLSFKPDQPNSHLPIMADKPGVNALLGNSLNHGGRGQNVLYLDGHVRFCTNRTIGVDDDDIYLNKVKAVAAGLNHLDTVLGSSASRP